MKKNEVKLITRKVTPSEAPIKQTLPELGWDALYSGGSEDASTRTATARLKARHDGLRDRPKLAKMVREVIRLGKSMTMRNRLEYRWLFDLVGVVKRMTPKSRRDEKTERVALAPLALLFIEVLRAHKVLRPDHVRIDYLNADEVNAQFQRDWLKRDHLAGDQVLETAIRTAREKPVDYGGTENFNFLLSVMQYLQEANGENPILLPVSETIADQLGVSKMYISNVIDLAINDGHLVQIEKAIATKKARRFRFYREPGYGNED